MDLVRQETSMQQLSRYTIGSKIVVLMMNTMSMKNRKTTKAGHSEAHEIVNRRKFISLSLLLITFYSRKSSIWIELAKKGEIIALTKMAAHIVFGDAISWTVTIMSVTKSNNAMYSSR